MIFGIGLPKTGTISLNVALGHLGLYSEHHSTNMEHLAKNYSGFDAAVLFCAKDFPIYDQLYPDARFIFTDRDDKSWLRSMENHIKTFRVNDHRTAYWRIRLFGSLKPTADDLLRLKWSHENDVNGYFADQQNRLLRIRICDGEGWEKLCPFLGKAIPKLSFPALNKTMRM